MNFLFDQKQDTATPMYNCTTCDRLETIGAATCPSYSDAGCVSSVAVQWHNTCGGWCAGLCENNCTGTCNYRCADSCFSSCGNLLNIAVE